MTNVLAPQDATGWVLFFFPIVIGFIIGFFSMKNQSYGACGDKAVRPPQPPGWVFGVAWTILYLLMGWSLTIVWNTDKRWSWYLITFIVLTIILDLWYLLFTRICNPKLASGILVLLAILFLLLALVFYKRNPVAGWILLPLILWLIYANYLSTPLNINL